MDIAQVDGGKNRVDSNEAELVVLPL